jgi:hypothetical protein
MYFNGLAKSGTKLASTIGTAFNPFTVHYHTEFLLIRHGETPQRLLLSCSCENTFKAVQFCRHHNENQNGLHFSLMNKLMSVPHYHLQ